MKFSIITPTLQRESLKQCCLSVDRQTYGDWEHIVWVDGGELNEGVFRELDSPKRMVFHSPKGYRDFGNTPRNLAWGRSTGDYVLYLDDDNYLADGMVLEDIASSLKKWPEWALYPIMRLGTRFFPEIPRSGWIDTANMVIRRGIACWPSGSLYEMDGFLAERLAEKYRWESFPDFRPIVIMEVQGLGR